MTNSARRNMAHLAIDFVGDIKAYEIADGATHSANARARV